MVVLGDLAFDKNPASPHGNISVKDLFAMYNAQVSTNTAKFNPNQTEPCFHLFSFIFFVI